MIESILLFIAGAIVGGIVTFIGLVLYLQKEIQRGLDRL